MQALLLICKRDKISIDDKNTITLVHTFLKKKKQEREDQLKQTVQNNLERICEQSNNLLQSLNLIIAQKTEQLNQLIENFNSTLNNEIETQGKEIRLIKSGQLLTHKVNQVFKTDGYDSDDDKILADYTNNLILQKPTVNMHDKINHVQNNITRISQALVQVTTQTKAIKAITNGE